MGQPRAPRLFGGTMQAFDYGRRDNTAAFGGPTEIGHGPSALWAREAPPYPAEAPPGGGTERQKRMRQVGVQVDWLPGPPRAADMGELRKRSFFLSRSIAGVSRDLSTGAPLGGCVVHCYLTATDVLVASTTSDAAGNFNITVPTAGAHYLVGYKDGGTALAGTSVNTLTAA